MFTRSKPFVLSVPLMATLISLLTFTIVLAASGGLDPTFSGDGKKTTNFGGEDKGEGVAVQSNGKIVVVGRSGNGNDFGLARYSANGSPDTTFSGDGKVITDFGGDDTAYDVAVQSNGKIVAVGDACNPTTDLCNLALARYNPDGTLDTTFSKDGKVVTDIGGQDNGARGVAIQADGKIVVIGFLFDEVKFHFVFYRYNTNGGRDTTFSGDGTSIGNFGAGRWDYGHDVVIQGNGKIVGIGSSYASAGGEQDFAMARLNANGTLDTTFAKGGLRLTDFGGDDSAEGVALQPDGKIIVAGYRIRSDILTELFALARYNSNGTLDTTFNGTGKKLFGFGPGSRSSAQDVIVQPNGKIVVVGNSGDANADKFALARLNPNGSLDTTFSGDGRLAFGFCAGSSDESFALARQPLDGKYVLAGSTRCITGGRDFAVARVLP